MREGLSLGGVCGPGGDAGHEGSMGRQDNAQVGQCHQGAGKKRDVWKCLPVIGEWQDGAGEESLHGWNIKEWL